MGLVNRVVPPGRALAAALELAHQLAALPQVCLRSDRMSALEQWGLSEEQAAVDEARRGRAVVASGETLDGAHCVSPEVRVAVALRSADRAQRAMTGPDRPTVAAFDFDGTLTHGGSVFPFLVALRGAWPVLGAVAGLSPELVRAAITGGSAADHVKEKLFHRLMGGLAVAEVDRRGADFAQRAPGPAPACRHHAPAGVAPAPGALHGHRLRLTRVLRAPGRRRDRCRRRRRHSTCCRGRWPPHRRLRGQELPRRREVRTPDRSSARPGPAVGGRGSQPVLWAYGNSRGDLRLLNAADHGVDAGRLGPLGRLRHFPRLADVGAAPRRGRLTLARHPLDSRARYPNAPAHPPT